MTNDPKPVADGGETPASSTEAFCTSGTSPTSAGNTAPPTIHLVGPGQVGQAFLRLLPDSGFRLVGVTDSSATVHDRRGLDAKALAEHKARGERLVSIAGNEALPTPLAIDLVAADIVVDARPTDPDRGEEALERSLAILRGDCSLALAGKDALAAGGDRLLVEHLRHRVGINAALGGAGLAVVRDLDRLRRECTAIACVGNASTTTVIEAVESGLSFDDGIRLAKRLGVLEPDPELDLTGRDAALKLIALVRTLWQRPIPFDEVPCADLRDFDADLLRERRSRGRTTRLVGRATATGDWSLGFEELEIGAPLAVPSNRVAYSFLLRNGDHRVQVGHGIGPDNTAAALFEDVVQLSAARRER